MTINRPSRPQILDIPWDELPVKFRQRWWRAYSFHPPARPEQAAEHVQTWLSRPGGWRAIHAAERTRQEEKDNEIADPNFEARMAELLAADIAADETRKHKIKADIKRADEFLRTASRDCAECLRPVSPCQMRCLRSLLHPDDRRVL